MIVTTTGPGPVLDSCAYAWLAPNTLAAATRTAITRVMTCLLLLGCCLVVGGWWFRFTTNHQPRTTTKTPQLSASVHAIPIRQEVDRVLRRVRDSSACQTN